VASGDKKTAHRLFEVDRSGYPMWFFAADRT